MPDQGRETNLAPAEVALNKLIEDTSKKVEEIEHKIESLHSDKGPELRYPDMGTNRPTGTKAFNKYALEKEKSDAQLSARQEMDQLLKSSPKELQPKLQSWINQWAYPDQKQEEMKKESKDIDKSQDFALESVYSYTQGAQPKGEEIQPNEKDQEVVPDEETPRPSTSDSFINSLNYYQPTEEPGDELKKDDLEPEIDDD